MVCGKPLAQVKTMHRRGIKLGEAPKCRGNETNLFDIATAVDTERESRARTKLKI